MVRCAETGSELPVPGTDLALTLVAYGHFGRPLLVFPPEAGAAYDSRTTGWSGPSPT